MGEPALAAATAALEASSGKLDRIVQVLKPAPDPGESADPLVSARARIKGHEHELLDWIDVAQRWLKLVSDHMTQHAPKALLKEESNALWTGTQRLRRDLLSYVFDSDSALASVGPDIHEGAELRQIPIEAAYRELFTELEPYRGLIAILDQNPSWKTAQTPTEIRATLQQRTADAARIRELFAEYRLHADTLLAQLRALVESES